MNMAPTTLNLRPGQESVLRAIFTELSQYEVTDYSLKVTLPPNTDRVSLNELVQMRMIQLQDPNPSSSEAAINASLLPNGIAVVIQLSKKWNPHTEQTTGLFEEWELS